MKEAARGSADTGLMESLPSTRNLAQPVYRSLIPVVLSNSMNVITDLLTIQALAYMNWALWGPFTSEDLTGIAMLSHRGYSR